MTSQVSWRILLAVAAAVIAWTSLLPPDDLPSTAMVSDKVLHLLGYAILGSLAVLSGLRWGVALVAATAFGLVLEVAQGVLGYRSFEGADLLADAVGALAGSLITERVLREVRRARADREQKEKRERRRARRAREQSAPAGRPRNPGRIAARQGPPTWQQVARRQGSKCWLCGTRTYEQDRIRQQSGVERLGKTYPCVDYVVAIDAGGAYDEGNVRLAHRHCAAARRDNPSLTTFGRPPRTYP